VEVKFEDLLGQHIADWQGKEGDGEIIIVTVEGNTYRMHHSQDCCEYVYVESIVGDWSDLILLPLLKAEVVTHGDVNPPEITKVFDYQDSFTWTFYKLATARGYVDIRWYGSSNGYYSEGVDFNLVSGPGVSVQQQMDAALCAQQAQEKAEREKPRPLPPMPDNIMEQWK
jgi:hypothetical protein